MKSHDALGSTDPVPFPAKSPSQLAHSAAIFPAMPPLATWKGKFKLPLREARPPNHPDDKVDSDKQVVNTGLTFFNPVSPNAKHGFPPCSWQHRALPLSREEPVPARAFLTDDLLV